jgi:octaprenyl-diphosphate synthase
LVLLSAKATGTIQQEHIVLAAVVEMIHTATLIHDDVLDEAVVRRHLATVNARWDNEASVLLGDFLFTHAFYLASTLPSTLACRTIGRSTNIVCEGEIRQKGSRGDYSLSEDDYLGIVEAKTAELCACSCRLGAHFAGASPETVESLDSFGRDLGIAFQIVDDLLDVTGDESEMGKSLGTDLNKQKPTLPLIRALELADVAERGRLVAAIESDDVRQRADLLGELLNSFGALEYTQDKALFFAERAHSHLDDLEQSDAVRTLRLMSQFVIRRKF